MTDLCIGLFVVAICLTIVAMVGHGLWVLTAYIFRVMTGADPSQDQRNKIHEVGEHCPGCGTFIPREAQYCGRCGFDRNSPKAAELRDLEATARQLQKLRDSGALDSASCEQFYRAMEARQRALLGHKPVAARSQKAGEKVLDVLPVAPSKVPKPVPAGEVSAVGALASQAAPVIPPQPPRPSFGEMVAAFMEERNILWVQIIAGMLIVGCSIALVATLWHQLERIPYFPFLIFAGITAAFFGAGLFALRYWKLETTSRGILVIATLLVPLNTLVMAGLTVENPGWLEAVLDVACVAAFAGMIIPTGRILAPGKSVLLLLAVLGTSACQLLVPWLVPQGNAEFWQCLLLGLLPVVCHDAGVALALRKANRQSVNRDQAKWLLVFLGLAFFTVVVTLGFLVYWSGQYPLTLQRLSVIVALVGIPNMLAGLLIQQRFTSEEPGTATAEQRATMRTIGTGIALAGIAVMLAALVLAWPQPITLISVCLLNVVVLTAIAFRWQLPMFHAVAVPCLVVAYLTAYHLVAGNLAEPSSYVLLQTASTTASAVGLAILAVLLGAVAEACVRLRQPVHSIYYVTAAGIVALISLIVVMVRGADEPGRCALVYGICGVAGLVMNVRWRQRWLTYAAAGALLICLVRLLDWQCADWPISRRWLLALLIHATVAIGGSLALKYRFLARHSGSDRDEVLAVPLRWSGLISSFAAVLPLLVPEVELMELMALCTLWLATIWLVVAWIERWSSLFTGYQLILNVAVLYAVTAWLAQQPWFLESPNRWVDPWSLQAYGIGLGVLSLLWVLSRLQMRTHPVAREMFRHYWTSVDRLVLALLVGGQFFLAIAAIVPDVARELLVVGTSPAPLTWPAAHGYGPGAWVLVVELLIVVLVAMREWFHPDITTRVFSQPDASARIEFPLVDIVWPTALILALATLAITTPILAAGEFAAELAGASALRWGLSICFLACSVILFLRRRLPASAARFGIGIDPTLDASQLVRIWLLAGTLFPVLILTCNVALIAFSGGQTTGPNDPSFFARIGFNGSNLVPLAILSVGLVGHALRERSPGYAFAAGLLVNVTLMSGYALAVATSGLPFDAVHGVRLLQLGTISASLWTIVWLVGRRWVHTWREEPGSPLARPLMIVQLAQGTVGNLLLLLPALVFLLLKPAGPMRPSIIEAGHIGGWLAIVPLLVAAIWYMRRLAPSSVVHVCGAGGLLIGILLACTASRWNQGSWLSHHILTVTWSLLGLFLLAASWSGEALQQIGPGFWSPERRKRAVQTLAQYFPGFYTRRWVEVIGVLVIFLAVRGAWFDPARPYWSSAATLTVSALACALALWTRRPVYVYVSGLLFNLIGMLAWHAWLVDQVGIVTWMAWGPGILDTFFYTHIICLALASACWTTIELAVHVRAPAVNVRGRFLPFSPLAALLSLHLMAILVVGALTSDLTLIGMELRMNLAWIALAAVIVALVICLWDRGAVGGLSPILHLHVAGLLVIGLGLHQAVLSPNRLGWTAALAVAGYVLLTTLLAWCAPRIQAVLRLPERRAYWFPPAQTVLACLVIGLSLWMTSKFATLADRLAGPLAMAVLLPSAILIARWSADALLTGDQQAKLGASPKSPLHPPSSILDSPFFHYAALSIGVLTVVESIWALLGHDLAPSWIDSNATGAVAFIPWMERSACLLVSFILMSLFYAMGLTRMLRGQGEWLACAHRLGIILGGLALAVLALLMIQEFMLYNPDPQIRRIPMVMPVFVAVLLALLALVSAELIFALVPRLDPLQAPESRRTFHVYAAEIILVVTLVHIRLNLPDLVPREIARYWPLIVMGLAYLGVGLSLFFKRRNVPVLSEPLRHTGIFLPLLPLIAFLARPVSDLLDVFGQTIPGLQPLLRYPKSLPSGFGMHAFLWFLLGLLYAILAVNRRSFRFGFLAALAANFALWVVFANNESVAFLVHPQLWLIPLAVILLVSEHINREQLGPAASSSLRYFALGMLYLSSTADMFIAGLGHSVLLPVVLAVLSVLGALTGILLRVRAFLYLGVGFLFLVVMSQIWHVAVDLYQTWLWWASGIVLGVAVLALFAVFEKRRNDVMRVLEELKRWE